MSIQSHSHIENISWNIVSKNINLRGIMAVLAYQRNIRSLLQSDDGQENSSAVVSSSVASLLHISDFFVALMAHTPNISLTKT
jgi:hypothetical protein